MQRFALVLLVSVLVGCAHNGSSLKPTEEQTREYSATAVTLSDFSMKIIAHYQSQNLSVPNNFDTDHFFTLLEKIYPDRSRVNSVRSSYRVFVRPLDGGYSVMLCDPSADRKVMEDLSCHVDRVEIRSWEKDTPTSCVLEGNWKPYCE
jgi:hypothetical protein